MAMILNEDTKDIYNLMKFVDDSFDKVIYNKSNNRVSDKYIEKYRDFKLNLLLPWLRDFKTNNLETPIELEEELYNILLDFYNSIRNFK